MLATVPVAGFLGFSADTLDFLIALRANNSREWFSQHRDRYERVLLEPARAFVVAMAELLPRLGEDLHAEPKIHGSILAINRDTRFSADKRPYKSHLDLWFWQGEGPGLNRERPGYFCRIAPEGLMLGAGMHAFAAEGVLERFRQAVLDPLQGEQLVAAAEAVGPERVQGRTYARVPRGLPAEHPRANWLRHSGLYAEDTIQPPPPEIFTSAFPSFCLDQFQHYRPLQQWLVDLLAS